ncbi:hypothetical protein IG631_23722 [Alternaria alternata]|nr:hypothetical protein IG631_23722 [Alternaria alternata]
MEAPWSASPKVESLTVDLLANFVVSPRTYSGIPLWSTPYSKPKLLSGQRLTLRPHHPPKPPPLVHCFCHI